MSTVLLRLCAVLCLALLGSCGGAEHVRTPSAGATVHVIAPLAMPGLDRSRQLRVYLPPSYAQSDRRYGVIYMHDGQNLFDDATAFAGEWGVDESMDELARGYGFEAIVVGIDNGGDKRMNELSAWPNERFGPAEGEQYTDFVVNVVKPYIDAHYRTQATADSTAIIGSSMGGLASHYAIYAHPQTFGKAAALSPSYWYAPAVYDYSRTQSLPESSRIYLYAGGKEGAEMVDGVDRMHALLMQRAGGAVTLNVVEAAEHNEAAWRTEFPRALIWLFQLQPLTPP